MSLEQQKHPIGKFITSKNITTKNIEDWISIIESFPKNLTILTQQLSENQLNTPYRKDGWSIRQVIHHCYDSHHNSYTRFKWTLTEENPIIKVYFEDRWAALNDSVSAPIHLSLDGLKALHAKWVFLLRNLSEVALEKTFIHPDGNEEVSLKENIGIYAWHCNHHFAHIEQLMTRENWK